MSSKKGRPTPKRSTAQKKPVGVDPYATPRESLKAFVYHNAEVLLEKIKILEKFEKHPDLQNDIIVREVRMNFNVATLAMIESLDLLNGRIPERMKKQKED